jgi:hypothetical protein
MASQSLPSLTKSTGTVVKSNSSAMRCIDDIGALGVVSVGDEFETNTRGCKLKGLDC